MIQDDVTEPPPHKEEVNFSGGDHIENMSPLYEKSPIAENQA